MLSWVPGSVISGPGSTMRAPSGRCFRRVFPGGLNGVDPLRDLQLNPMSWLERTVETS